MLVPILYAGCWAAAAVAGSDLHLLGHQVWLHNLLDPGSALFQFVLGAITGLLIARWWAILLALIPAGLVLFEAGHGFVFCAIAVSGRVHYGDPCSIPAWDSLWMVAPSLLGWPLLTLIAGVVFAWKGGDLLAQHSARAVGA